VPRNLPLLIQFTVNAKTFLIALPLEIYFFCKKQRLSAIIIKSDHQNIKILKELAKKLGADLLIPAKSSPAADSNYNPSVS